MKHFTSRLAQKGATQIKYGVWHQNPDEWHCLKLYSFILLAARKLPPFNFMSRKYLAGFSLDGTGAVIPIADDILYSYD